MSNRIYIVGIGPGREEMMTGEAIAALEQADVIVGYTVYVKFYSSQNSDLLYCFYLYNNCRH